LVELYVPISQLIHEEAPIEEEEVPAAQFIQLDCAIKALYLPELHTVQKVIPDVE
jgi:hypothetical protein